MLIGLNALFFSHDKWYPDNFGARDVEVFLLIWRWQAKLGWPE